MESKTHGDLSFQLITHSHDTVDLKQVDFLVTEDGIMDKAAISEFIKAPEKLRGLSGSIVV